MKEKFLALVNEVKATGIVETLRNASNAEELKEVWQKFVNEKPELCAKIKEWADKFKNSEGDALFESKEDIENPMEVVVCIRIINDDDVKEDEICTNYEDLINAVRNGGHKFDVAVAKYAEDNYFMDIEAEDVFAVMEEAESDDDDDDGNENEEEAESGDGNGDGGAEPENSAENAECDDDSGADAEEPAE